MIPPVQIGRTTVGPGSPCFIVAEVGVNHNGDPGLAHALIDTAASARVDAVKFQSFSTEALVTRNALKAAYQIDATGDSNAQYAMLKALELNAEQHMELKAHCEKLGLVYLCTPYDPESVDMLDRMEVAAFKIASTDVSNTPLLRHVATKGRPVILSTGMSTIGEVEEAIGALCTAEPAGRIILLHCTSEYPAPTSEANLRAIRTMQHAFACPVGFSDHTAGVGASPWAVAVGACLIEKHLTLDRGMPGPDHRASLESSEFAALVCTVREVEEALGDGVKRPMPSETRNKRWMQKALVATRMIARGEHISADDLACKRPATGLSPSWLDRVVGRRAAADIPENAAVTLSSIDWSEP
jgi:N-acetylneuraminate synthase